MFQLNSLSRLIKKRKRIGRGGSRGGTSGRGHKGQKARTGESGIGIGFEGGQMPLVRRLPKRGFSNKRFAKEVKIINLRTLERLCNDGDEVTKERLRELGIIKGKSKFHLKILGMGTLSKKIIVQADAASKSAVEAIEKAGGSVTLIVGI